MHGLLHLTTELIEATIQRINARTVPDDIGYLFHLISEQRDELKALCWYGTGERLQDFDYHRGHVIDGREYLVSPALMRAGLERLEAESMCVVQSPH